MIRLLVKDSMTEVSVDAYRVSELSAGLGEPIARRAGFGRAEDQATYVILVRLSGGVEAQSDPMAWRDWTMRAAHIYLLDHLEEHPHGGAIDVEAMRLSLVGGP